MNQVKWWCWWWGYDGSGGPIVACILLLSAAAGWLLYDIEPLILVVVVIVVFIVYELLSDSCLLLGVYRPWVVRWMGGMILPPFSPHQRQHYCRRGVFPYSILWCLLLLHDGGITWMAQQMVWSDDAKNEPGWLLYVALIILAPNVCTRCPTRTINEAHSTICGFIIYIIIIIMLLLVVVVL